MHSSKSGFRTDWTSYASALVDRADGMLVREEHLSPAAGDVVAIWTLPAGGDWGREFALTLSAAKSGADRLAFVDIETLADAAASSAVMHRLWGELLDEDRRYILEASEPLLGKWDDDGGRTEGRAPASAGVRQ